MGPLLLRRFHQLVMFGISLRKLHVSFVLFSCLLLFERVYICGPTISPTGLLYSNHEIEKILSACERFGARVIMDTSFSGLEFGSDGWGGWDLANSLSKLNSSSNPAFSVCLLRGLLFKLLTGALKFGFLVFNLSNMVHAFQSFPGLSKPHGTVKYAVKKLLGLRERKAGELMDAVATHIEMLKTRSKRLKETLEENGWDVLEPCAGLSMVAKPSVYLDKTLSIKPIPKDGVCAEEGSTYDIKIDNSNIREALLRSTGLCINSSSWTGIPGYCRFSIALDENEFDQALGCIVKFGSAVSS